MRPARKFLAQLIVFVVSLPHLVGVLLALWLDEDVVKKYLDGLVKARRELDVPGPEEMAAVVRKVMASARQIAARAFSREARRP